MTRTATIEAPSRPTTREAQPRPVAAPRPDTAPTDADIATQIKQTLSRLSSIDSAAIEVRVKHGVVTLCGSVRCWTEWHTVERVAWCPRGVSGVHNRIVIAYQCAPS
jgi:osmotically-inducible protein OsmY